MWVTCFILEFVKTRSTSDVASYLWSSVKCFGKQCREACSENCSIKSLKWACYVWVGNTLNTILARVLGCPYLCMEVQSPKNQESSQVSAVNAEAIVVCVVPSYTRAGSPPEGAWARLLPLKRIYVLSGKLLKLFQESYWAMLCSYLCIHTLPSSIFNHFSFKVFIFSYLNCLII